VDRQLAIAGFIAFIAACGSTALEKPGESVEPHQEGALTPPPEPARAPSQPGEEGGSSNDAPQISRSVGEPGGFVVLYPRIALPRSSAGQVPDSELKSIASQLQQRLAEIAKRVRPNAKIDVRPEPERVCPRSGCKAASLGVVVTRAGAGCAAVALISAPGTSPQRLVPWAAQMRLKEQSVPFREPPERAVGVTDYVRCGDLVKDAATQDAAVEKAVKELQF